ncbi:hypothetical protein V6N13_112687 [Hibiscus sabdariffa]|uniref:Response regulatory domain-containing protein n=1 Tax=Hibiscus sabdariffa TaxID=183260 RepID=A0ABR2TPG8_9ROSI
MAPAFPSGDDRADFGTGEHKQFSFHDIVLRNRLTALVVDGVDFCRLVEQGFLRSCGLETQGVNNGDAAVELIASGAKFDLIIIDMFLPVMDGLETTRRIRALGERCKIVGVSAYIGENDREAFLAAGGDVFSEKPVSPEVLIPILRELDGQYSNI